MTLENSASPSSRISIGRLSKTNQKLNRVATCLTVNALQCLTYENNTLGTALFRLRMTSVFLVDFWNNSDTESDVDLQLSTGGFDQEDDDFDFYG